jgi:tetratricopeptide (TPR) repeat protein
MSFTLSKLGDFEGALRETKRALELDSYYVPQKFELAMDVEYEDPDLSIQPDFGAERAPDSSITDFSVDAKSLDALFTQLSPKSTPEPLPHPVADSTPFAMAADYLSKGLYDRASAEISRVMSRSEVRADGLALHADVFMKQGAFGEALERYRDALRLDANLRAARIGEVHALILLGKSAEARPLAQQLLNDAPGDVDLLMLAAAAHADAGDPATALALLDAARRAAPGRADVLQRIGDVSQAVGDVTGAIAAYRHAISVEPNFAIVRFRLARLLQTQGYNLEADQELTAALEILPTFADAALELAILRRRLGRADEALDLLIDLLRRDPYHFDGLIVLGETLVALGKHRDALAAFARVLRFTPTHQGALFHEGVVLSELHRYGEALQKWEQVIAVAANTEYAAYARRETDKVSAIVRRLGTRMTA